MGKTEVRPSLKQIPLRAPQPVLVTRESRATEVLARMSGNEDSHALNRTVRTSQRHHIVKHFL